MNQPSQVSLRETISKILVKWNMPTRQIAIDELLATIAEEVRLAKIQEQVLFQDWLYNPEDFGLDTIANWSTNRIATLSVPSDGSKQ